MTQPIDLPEHVAAAGEWKSWPRKLDAHLKWGVRQRQLGTFIRNGRLKVYRCPDETLRFDSEAMVELFGPPDVVQGRDRDLSADKRRAKQTEISAELDGDPLVLMFNRATSMITELFAQNLAQMRGCTEPLTALLGGYQAALQTANARIATLETQRDELGAQQIELEELRAERDRRMAREQAAERRRDETLQLLKDQLPTIASTWLAGDTLSGFAKRTPRAVIESLLESETLTEQDSDLLRRAVGIPRPAPAPNPSSNGAS